MSNEDVSKYFDATEFRETRENLIYAVSLIEEPKIAIDCGCGAGSDIDYLVRNGFTVHGFDIEEEAILRCRVRFGANDHVMLSQSSFLNYTFPPASLVVAEASLFFCQPSDFEKVWSDICSCLLPNGVFCGSFLGTEDTMAIPGENPSVFWPAVTAFKEQEVEDLFNDLQLLRFNTHKSSGKTSQGISHEWHIFQVVAQKS